MSQDYEDNVNCGCAVELPNYVMADDVRPMARSDESLIKEIEDLVARRGMTYVLTKSEYLAFEFGQYFEKD